MVKRSILVFSILLILVVASWADVIFDGSTYEEIARNESLILYYRFGSPAIIVENLATGFRWSSSVHSDNLGSRGSNRFWRANTDSLFSFSYTDFGKRQESTNPLMEQVDVYEALINSGVRVSFDFVELEISLVLEITISNDSLIIDIPSDDFVEDGVLGVVDLDVLPFFGAARDDEDGYIVLPDGSGSIYDFKGRPADGAREMRWPVYGSDQLQLGREWVDEWMGIHHAMLPVFGMRRRTDAFVAIVEKGEFDSVISFSPSGLVIELNRACVEFTFRRSYNDMRPDLRTVMRVEPEVIAEDRRMSYTFLDGDEADYSGMAVRYRQFLLENGDMVDRIVEGDTMPSVLSLFMGITEERLLLNKYIAMTTFDEAREMVHSLVSSGVAAPSVNLVGWTKGGYGTYPAGFPNDRGLGGKKDLRELAAYAEANGVRLYLEDNVVDADAAVGGFSRRKDVVYRRSGLAATDIFNRHYLLNPVVSFRRFQKNIPKYARYGIGGVTFMRIGELVFFDHNKEYPMTRNETGSVWIDFLDSAKGALGSVASYGGNAYVLKASDLLFNIPVSDSSHFLLDRQIPFYQIVVHGFVPYVSGPANLFYDNPVQKLLWIEYGCAPHYLLTYQQAELLRDTDYSLLFSSYYEDWLPAFAKLYEEFEDRLDGTWSNAIVDHEELGEDLRVVRYSNGTSIYLNYGITDVILDGIRVPSLDYTVVTAIGEAR